MACVIQYIAGRTPSLNAYSLNIFQEHQTVNVNHSRYDLFEIHELQWLRTSTGVLALGRKKQNHSHDRYI
jgi:hypothetical protein